MAATAVSTVLSKFGELTLNEGRLLVEVGDKMMLLRDRLEWLQAFIRDADRKRRTGTDGLSRVWLRQTRDVAFQVEDALDEFFHQVDLESQGYEGWKKWGKYLGGCWTQITVRHVLSDRLDKINSRLEQISENQKEYNIKHTPLVTLTSSTTTTAAWQDERNYMVGFGEDVKALEEVLLRKDDPYTMFISIIGESGVGKGTLANALFEKLPDTEVIKLVVFMQPDSPEEVVQTLYNTLSKVMIDLDKPGEDADPAGKLRGCFSDRKYMLFLGGITSIPMLNLLITCLPVADNKNGSTVVLVLDAENEEVGWHANKMNKVSVDRILLLTRFDEKRSGQLFRSKALRKEVSDGKEAMDNYDHIVFGITRGHPMSIVLLGGLLRFKEQPLQWDAVLQQLMPAAAAAGSAATQQVDMEANLSPSTSIERIFWASFEDLPNDIKSCFLYLVIAGKNVVLDAKNIVLMWIGEGFIKPHKGRTMEELGHRYVKELALRCLILVHSRDDAGGIAQVQVHKSLHDFLQSEAREAGFLDVHDIHHVLAPPSARRLSFQIYGGRYTRFTKKLPKLRSFISFDAAIKTRDNTGANKEFFDLKFLLGSKFLRVIVLEGQKIKELPKEIGNLLELRYIGVRSKELKELPASIKRLLNLQTLDITSTAVQRIDPGFWKIKTLRHVFANSLTLPAECLEEELGELQTLWGVQPPQGQAWNADNCPLHKMRKLRTLWLKGVEHEQHRAALESALQEMHLLVSVTLKGDLLPSCVFTAKNLRFLEVIQLSGRLDWPRGKLNARLLRPNLRLTAVDPIEEVPAHIIEELQW